MSEVDKNMSVKIIMSDISLVVPAKATGYSAGYDIRSAIDVVLKVGEIKIIPTGLRMEMPNNLECQVRSRSGLAAKHGVCVFNGPGTIDADYRDEIGIILANFGTEDFKIEKNMRIAQLVFAKIIHTNIVISDKLSDSKRNGGFGSTGLK